MTPGSEGRNSMMLGLEGGNLLKQFVLASFVRQGTNWHSTCACRLTRSFGCGHPRIVMILTHLVAEAEGYPVVSRPRLPPQKELRIVNQSATMG